MNFAQEIIQKAQGTPKKLILPEGIDPRVLIAAEKIMEQKIAESVTVLGDPNVITDLAKQHNVNTDSFEIVDFANHALRKDFTHEYFELRKSKGITEEQADKEMNDDVFFGAKMLSKGMFDAMVSGSFSPTSKTLRAAIFFGSPRVKTISSAMVMQVSNTNLGEQGKLIFGDCAVVPDPNAEQLADIAENSASAASQLFGIRPRVAMLSFSTNGSAKHPDADKVIEAIEILKKRGVDFDFDGEMQLDAAVAPEVAALKYPNSAVAGKANVLVFPDLGAANIGYKLVQRFSPGAEAYGPLLQGINKAINDLSRGCSYEDIIATSAITLVQAHANELTNK